jgi:hypothetical protein
LSKKRANDRTIYRSATHCRGIELGRQWQTFR